MCKTINTIYVFTKLWKENHLIHNLINGIQAVIDSVTIQIKKKLKN